MKDKQAAHISATLEEVSEPAVDSMELLNVHNNVSRNKNLIDLYSVGHETVVREMCNIGSEVPFKHALQIKGPQGEIVRVSALFDGVAMVAAMCQSVFERVKHKLGTWMKSEKLLRMANKVIIPLQAIWLGMMQIGDVEVEGSFEVFDSKGGWAFLLGKPLLWLSNARQDFVSDTVVIGPKVIVIHNEIKQLELGDKLLGINIILDKEQVEEKRLESINEPITSTVKDKEPQSVLMRETDP